MLAHHSPPACHHMTAPFGNVSLFFCLILILAEIIRELASRYDRIFPFVVGRGWHSQHTSFFYSFLLKYAYKKNYRRIQTLSLVIAWKSLHRKGRLHSDREVLHVCVRNLSSRWWNVRVPPYRQRMKSHHSPKWTRLSLRAVSLNHLEE